MTGELQRDALVKHALPAPGAGRVGGLWGRRLGDTIERWMLHVSQDALLDGFRSRPGVQPWIGEHLGKYLCGAIGASGFFPRPDLAERVRGLVEAWVPCQEEDGYLGTYLPPDRWKPGDPAREAQTPCWDLWVHKYAILALLSYEALTGWAPALEAARRAGELVAAEFGPDSPRDLNRTDEHAGLASGSALEAMLLLHRRTGEARYLDFAHRVVGDFWEREDGPRIMPALRDGAPAHTIGDGKAYEMMSCFVGLTEYARATADIGLVQLLVATRDRIADQLRYPTGGMSDVEWFKPPGCLREEAPLETCVSFTWIQWNLRLFELTGDARALDLAEETAWNQILPAVCPDGSTWTYHLPTTGPKAFSRRWIQGVDGRYEGASLSCCHTNGQRALALFPQYAYTAAADGALAVNFYGACSAELDLPDAGRVQVEQETAFPADGAVRLRVRVQGGGPVAVALRVPGWAGGLQLDGTWREAGADGRVRTEVTGEQRLQIELPMEPRLLVLGGSNRGKVSLARGPLVFALDQPPDGWSLDQVALELDPRDAPADLAVSSGLTGWPAVEAPLARLAKSVVAEADQSGAPQRATGRLEPILFAGLDGHPRWDVADGDDAPWDAASTRSLPTYRSMFPLAGLAVAGERSATE